MSMLSWCYDGGERGTCLGSVQVAPFVPFFFMDHYDSLLRWSATVAITLVMDRYGSDYLCMAGKRASASSGAYRRVPQIAGVM